MEISQCSNEQTCYLLMPCSCGNIFLILYNTLKTSLLLQSNPVVGCEQVGQQRALAAIKEEPSAHQGEQLVPSVDHFWDRVWGTVWSVGSWGPLGPEGWSTRGVARVCESWDSSDWRWRQLLFWFSSLLMRGFREYGAGLFSEVRSNMVGGSGLKLH